MPNFFLKVAKMFLKSLPDFLECVILDKTLLHSKLKLYLERYLTRNYAIVAEESFIKYFKILKFKNIILKQAEFNKYKQILQESKDICILVLHKGIEFKIHQHLNIINITIPKMSAFDSAKNRLYRGEILADWLAENIVLFIKNKKDLSNLQDNKIIPFKQKYCSLRLLYKNDVNEMVFGQNVGEFRINLGKILASYIDKSLIKNLDYIIPVPSSGIFYAVGLSQNLNVPFLPALRKQEVSERSFEIINTDVRKNYLYTNMQINSYLIKNKKILLVDEAIFTGATLKVVCDILRDNQVGEIHLAIPSPKCYNQCDYLMLPKRTLLLEKIRENVINQYLNVDSLTFLPFTIYKDALYSVNQKLCLECFENKGAMNV